MTVELELEVLGLLGIEEKLSARLQAFEDALKRALAITAQRGHDWLESNAPQATGEYVRSIELDISPTGDVRLSVKAGHAKPLEATTGIFNRMIKETMSRDIIMKEISRQMEAVR